MFPSLDTNGYELFDPFTPQQTTMLPSFNTHIQSPSSHHYLYSSSLPFSSDFLYNVDDSFLINQFLLQQQDAAVSKVVESPRKVCKKLEQRNNNEKCLDINPSEKVPRRSTAKKRDRHSKICTAQGPRDRRMRLSLQIARKFFDLQDMLGFDKASKTIEWLFSKSKTSIKQLKESVAASGGGGDYQHLQVDEKTKDETLKVKVSKRRTKTMESSCKTKELRERARKRARERTMTKIKMRLSGLIDTSPKNSDPHEETREIKITSSIEGENHTTANMEENQMYSVSIIEKFLGLTSDSSSSSIFGDSEESYTSFSSIRGTPSTSGMVTPSEDNITSILTMVDEDKNPISSFSLYDYLWH